MDDQLKEYEVGPVQFSGGADALYERHLIFDDVIAVEDAGLRECYEAMACAVRDVLSQHTSEMERSNVTYTEMFKMLKRKMAKEKGIIL